MPFNFNPLRFLTPTLNLLLKNQTTEATTLARTESKLDAAITEDKRQMAKIDDEISILAAQVASNTTVIDSAKALIAGFSAQLSAAVAAALAEGATPAQLQKLTDLGVAVKQSDDALAAAVVAGTTPPAA